MTEFNPFLHTKGPMKYVDRLFEWQYQRQVVSDSAAQMRRIDIMKGALAFVLVLVGMNTDNVVARMIVAGFAGLGASLWLARRLAYRRGWWDGRKGLFDSSFEAQERGLSFNEWLASELERDWKNLM